MSLYAIGDLHLALGTPQKSMEVFGGRWTDYVRKIEQGFSLLREEDVCVICGDFSWAMDLETALPDFRFLNALPGKKLLLKGNHDFWWSTASKLRLFFESHCLDTLSILHNNCALYGETALCGTRGWMNEPGTAADKKVLAREAGRLKLSLEAGKALGKQPIVFLHYPPIAVNSCAEDLLGLMQEYGVTRCYYGHLHGQSCLNALYGQYRGVEYRLISGDYIQFDPELVI